MHTCLLRYATPTKDTLHMPGFIIFIFTNIIMFAMPFIGASILMIEGFAAFFSSLHFLFSATLAFHAYIGMPRDMKCRPCRLLSFLLSGHAHEGFLPSSQRGSRHHAAAVFCLFCHSGARCLRTPRLRLGEVRDRCLIERPPLSCLSRCRLTPHATPSPHAHHHVTFRAATFHRRLPCHR